MAERGKTKNEGISATRPAPSRAANAARLKKKRGPFTGIAEGLMPYYPDLKKKMYSAGMIESPMEFLEKMVSGAIFSSLAATLVFAVLLNMLYINVLFALIAFPFIMVGAFYYLMFYPDARISKRQRDIDSEIVFAGRHLLIALRAGMPLFDSMVGVSANYGTVSEEFRRIVEKINLGVPMGQALRESAASCPSNSFARILMQISNAISSGADIAGSLDAVLSQIAKEQAIGLKAYGQKLNPLIMFYMIFGIIFPSLGVAFAIILFSLVSGGAIGLNQVTLIYIAIVIALVQFIFLSIIESSRPRFMM
jgi:archaeal flagellar protein FlaJ